MVDLQLSSSRLALAVGEAATLGATGLDAVGNATADAVSFASCDGAVVSVGAAAEGLAGFTTSATVQAAGLGVSCVTASAGGFTDTIRVSTGPAGVRIVGPDTVPSGGEGTYTLEAFDAAGAALTGSTAYEWFSSNKALMSIDIASGVAQGKTPGSVAARVFAPGGANAAKTVVVIPGVFAGTLTAASAGPGALITATRAATGPKFDADVGARVGTTAAFVDLITPEAVTFAVPARGSTAATSLSLTNMGPGQVTQTTAFTVTATAADIYQPGNITNNCTAPATPPTWSAVRSPNGTSQGTRGCQNSGAVTGYDHYFTYTTGASAETVDVLAYWTLAGDNDIYVCRTDFSSCPGSGFSGNTLDELGATNVALAANTSYFIIYSPWTANTGTNNIRIRVVRK